MKEYPQENPTTSADDPISSREMYQEHILELYRHPDNFGKLPNTTHSFRNFNPLCGDDITIELAIKDDTVNDVKFHGHGCALSTASASLLTEKIKKMKISDVMKLTRDSVLELIQIPVGPVRLKCVLIPLEAIQKAAHTKVAAK